MLAAASLTTLVLDAASSGPPDRSTTAVTRPPMTVPTMTAAVKNSARRCARLRRSTSRTCCAVVRTSAANAANGSSVTSDGAGRTFGAGADVVVDAATSGVSFLKLIGGPFQGDDSSERGMGSLGRHQCEPQARTSADFWRIRG